VVGLVGISRDITGRVQTEEAMRRLNQQLGDRVKELSLLNRLSEELQGARTIEVTYSLIAQFMSHLSLGQVGALYLVNAERTHVTTAATWGVPALELQVFGLDDCWALRLGQLHQLDPTHPHWPCRHLKGHQPYTTVCLPLLAHGEVLGVLNLRAPDEASARAFEETTQQLAHFVADSVAMTWANLMLRENLREQAIRDPLTDLFSRRYMEETLARELLRADRNQQPVSLIMLDLDHSKHFNDTFGHEAGDAVLLVVGNFLRAQVRGDDIACRYGGEEFLLILPQASLPIARKRAEAIQAGVKRLELRLGNQALGLVTLSIGVAAFPNQGPTAPEVLRAVEQALSRAKEGGRDQVVVME
jgi:diguanylate cyclase (GGDEF)-like protein